MKLQLASIARGKANRAWAKTQIEKLKGVADRKRSKPSQPLMVDSAELESQVLMCELSPKLLSDEERGASDSVNARLHRILTNG